MNRVMTVYLPNGDQYFHTDTVLPADETREEDYWVAQGYVVVFTESAAAQESSDVRESVKTSKVISDRPSSMLTPAPAADQSKETGDFS